MPCGQRVYGLAVQAFSYALRAALATPNNHAFCAPSTYFSRACFKEHGLCPNCHKRQATLRSEGQSASFRNAPRLEGLSWQNHILSDRLASNESAPSKRPLRPGRGSRIRTRDPRFWRPMLYQLSYTPRPERWCAAKMPFVQWVQPRFAMAASASTSPPQISASWARIRSIGQSHQATALRRAISSGSKRILIGLAGLPARMV